MFVPLSEFGLGVAVTVWELVEPLIQDLARGSGRDRGPAVDVEIVVRISRDQNGTWTAEVDSCPNSVQIGVTPWNTIASAIVLASC